jgi:hypothetical protein
MTNERPIGRALSGAPSMIELALPLKTFYSTKKKDP